MEIQKTTLPFDLWLSNYVAKEPQIKYRISNVKKIQYFLEFPIQHSLSNSISICTCLIYTSPKSRKKKNQPRPFRLESHTSAESSLRHGNRASPWCKRSAPEAETGPAPNLMLERAVGVVPGYDFLGWRIFPQKNPPKTRPIVLKLFPNCGVNIWCLTQKKYIKPRL